MISTREKARIETRYAVSSSTSPSARQAGRPSPGAWAYYWSSCRIGNLENHGQNARPSTVRKLAKALDVSPGDLMGD